MKVVASALSALALAALGLPQAVPSLDRDAELVVYCHHGTRSAAAAAAIPANT